MARIDCGAHPFDWDIVVDACAPVVLELGERGSLTPEQSLYVRDRPAAGWLSCRITTRFVIGGYHEEDFEVWDSRGKLVAQARQLAALTLADGEPRSSEVLSQ